MCLFSSSPSLSQSILAEMLYRYLAASSILLFVGRFEVATWLGIGPHLAAQLGGSPLSGTLEIPGLHHGTQYATQLMAGVKTG